MAGMNNLATLLKRLEAATSRLEDMAQAQFSLPTLPAAPPVPPVPPAPAPPTSAPTAPEVDAPSVQDYKGLVEGPLNAFVQAAAQVGGVAEKQAQLAKSAFEAQLAFLQAATQCKKPSASDAAYQALLKDTQTSLMDTIEVQDPDKARKATNHLKMVAEGIPALGWVTVEPKPGPYVKDTSDSAEFYANRVIKEYKESDPKHVTYARSFISLLEALRSYVMRHHTTGVVWNAKGQDAAAYVAKRPSANASAAPPPPPPPAPVAPKAPQVAASSPQPKTAEPEAGMGAVFAQLNKGESVTSSLKKVDDAQKTHKNPDLRTKPTPVASPSQNGPAKPVKPPKPASYQKKPPKLELDRNKWIVENHENNPSIVISETAINQVVDVYNCKSSTIQIKGKVNAINLLNCSKVSILLDSLVSSLSITASPSFGVQVLGTVPTITVDATDGGQIYLGKESLGTEIITAKSSSINVSLPVPGEEDGVFAESPVPEQLKTTIKGGKLVTSVVEHAG